MKTKTAPAQDKDLDNPTYHERQYADRERKPPFVRSQSLNYDTNHASDMSGISCPEPTLAQQHFAEESDINYIAEKFGLTGELPTVINTPSYGDFSGIFDFQTAQNAVRKALEDFNTLPAKIRNRFENDPQKLLQFLDKPENREEAEFLGLVNKPVQDPPQSPRSDPAPKGKGDLPPPDPEGAGDLPPKPSKKDKN